MRTYRCADHGFVLTVAADGHRSLTTPPPASTRDRRGIPGDCALPVCPGAELRAGELRRRHPLDGSPLLGTCHIEEVG